MKAVCWQGIRRVGVETVPDPKILNPRDIILKVLSTTICGSDLHLFNGYMPAMECGDIIGHEFMGEIVEIGREVKNLQVGDRVVVPSVIGCGKCSYCHDDLWSLCDNTNPNSWMAEKLWGFSPCGIFGYTHLLGGYAGSHAQYIRVPFADTGARKLPENVTDDQALFISDAFPTGFMGADFCDIKPGQVVAVWGAGAVGLFAMKSAQLLGAHQVIAIDHIPARLKMAEEFAGAVAIDFSKIDVQEALRELTAGRGPDACIDAVGLEAQHEGLEGIYDRVRAGLFIESGRPHVLREAIYACRKGGIISVIGVYGGLLDHLPFGALMNKGLTLRTGQMHVQRYLNRLIEYTATGQVDPSRLVTHRMKLDEAPRGYSMFNMRTDECLRVVFRPND